MSVRRSNLKICDFINVSLERFLVSFVVTRRISQLSNYFLNFGSAAEHLVQKAAHRGPDLWDRSNRKSSSIMEGRFSAAGWFFHSDNAVETFSDVQLSRKLRPACSAQTL